MNKRWKTNVGISRYYSDGVVICRTLDRQNSDRQNHIVKCRTPLNMYWKAALNGLYQDDILFQYLILDSISIFITFHCLVTFCSKIPCCNWIIVYLGSCRSCLLHFTQILMLSIRKQKVLQYSVHTKWRFISYHDVCRCEVRLHGLRLLKPNYFYYY